MASSFLGARAQRDLFGLIVAALLFAWASVHFELSEQLLALTSRNERYQLDELPLVLLFVAAGLAWYAWRRVREARVEIVGRRAVEARLRDALADNRALALAAVQLQEDERRTLARELHDELGQHLNAMKIDAVSIRDRLPESSAEIERIGAALDRIQAAVRGIVRRLRPPGLDELGLCAAIEDCVDGWQARLPGVTFRLAMHGDVSRLPEAASITLYRLVQEGLTNVARHAEAALVEITLACSPDEVRLSMRDDGRGVTTPHTHAGTGLAGMRERVEALAGRFEIAAGEHGFGFVATLPRNAAQPA
jgi:signal transduction histidine kinase